MVGAPLMKTALKADLDTTWTYTSEGTGPASEKLFLFSTETPRNAIGDELSTEYFVEKKKFPEVLRILFNLDQKTKDLINNIEIRPMVGDEFLMSSAYKKFVFGINISWILDEPVVVPIMDALEKKIIHLIHGTNFSKNFNYGYQDIEKIFGSRIQKFRNLRDQYDSQKKLENLYYLEKFGEHTSDDL